MSRYITIKPQCCFLHTLEAQSLCAAFGSEVCMGGWSTNALPISSFLFVSLCGTLERGWRRRRVYNNTPRPLFSPHKPSKHTFAAPSLPWIVLISVFMQWAHLPRKPSADRAFILSFEVSWKKNQSWPLKIYWPKASFQELCKSCNFSFPFFGVRLQL